MENKFNNKKIIFGVLITFIGLLILISPYFNLKKIEVFEDMNNQYYEYKMQLNIDLQEINSQSDINSIVNSSTTTVPIINEEQPNKVDSIDNYFIGYLEISKINLKRGFTAINSKFNNVNRNIYVVPSSTFPDTINNNLILASHSGNGAVSFFKNLYQLELEDEAIITYQNKTYKYKIKKIYTDSKDGSVIIKRDKFKNSLTLITCTKGDSTTQTIYIAELT